MRSRVTSAQKPASRMGQCQHGREVMCVTFPGSPFPPSPMPLPPRPQEGDERSRRREE